MSLMLQCGSFVIDSKNKDLIQASRFDFSWELAAKMYFKNTLFKMRN